MHGCAPKQLEFVLPWGIVAAQEWKEPEASKKVLLLHGWQDNSNTFKKLVPLLPKEYWILALDSLGHGKSSHRVPGLPYHVPDYLLDIKATLARKILLVPSRTPLKDRLDQDVLSFNLLEPGACLQSMDGRIIP